MLQAFVEDAKWRRQGEAVVCSGSSGMFCEENSMRGYKLLKVAMLTSISGIHMGHSALGKLLAAQRDILCFSLTVSELSRGVLYGA